MSRNRTVVLGVVAWVVVVTAGALLVWTVISRAGAGVAGELPSVPPSETRPRASGGPTGEPTSEPTGADSARRTWQGPAGVVIADCDASAISFVGAQPNSGWRIEVDSTGPDLLRVEFETTDESTRTRVEGTCVAGRPEFTADTRAKG